MFATLDDQLRRSRGALHVQIARYEDSHLLGLLKVPLATDGTQVRIDFDDTVVTALCKTPNVPDRPEAINIKVTCTMAKGSLPNANVGIGLTFKDWSRENYVLMPGAAYNGNRFESRTKEYPPQLSDPQDIGPEVPTIISDVPRLEMHEGKSRLQLMTRDMTGAVKLHHPIPFSSAGEIQVEKYNLDNWDEQHGYYSVAFRDNIFSCWQVGLVGGMMVTYPFIFEGTADSRSRALRNFEFVFPDGQGRSGFFHGCGDGQKWYGDNFAEPFGRPWHLLRKSGDALYYIVKQLLLLQKQYPAWRPPEKWPMGARRYADAFVRLWDTWGQFGQFVDVETGDIIIGGSTSAGIARAGLVLASRHLGEERYLKVAKAAATQYFEKYVKAGTTTGGPCDCCQCPDSESAYGLLESSIVLHEETGEARWIEMARNIANQFFTWCEVSNMLTYVEVPGLYVQPDTSCVCAIDHIDVETAESVEGRLVLNVGNPTRFKAMVKVFSEHSTEMSKPLGQNYLWGCRRIALEANSRQDVIVE